MSGCTSTYRSTQGKPDWLDALSRNPSFFNPRTLDVNQLITIPAPSRYHNPASRVEISSGSRPTGEPFMPPRSQPAPIINWVQESMATWSDSAYELIPVDDVDTIYKTRANQDFDDDEENMSIATDFGDEPLILEAVPPYAPFSREGPDDTLFGLRNQLRQGAVITTSRTPKRAPEPSQTRSDNTAPRPAPRATWTGLFEETEYPGYMGAQSFGPDFLAHDQSDLTCSSGDGSPSSSSGGMCTTSIRELIATELRNVSTHCTAVCRRLGRKLRR